MKNVELIASYWTLAGGAIPHTGPEASTFEFRERIEAAARAGFKGVGLWHADIEHTLKRYSFAEMKKILTEIQDGSFAQEWVAESESGRKRFKELQARGKEHQIERVGEQLRGMMPWISEGKQRVEDASGG